MAEVLTVEVRDVHGKRRVRRMRNSGAVPAVLYGHGQETVSLAVPAKELDAIVRHGGRMVSLTGGVSESALIRELQWDTWGQQILHVDFARISEHERIEVQLTVELRGEAPGVKDGGVLDHQVHELTIECEAGSIPEKISVNINSLELDGSILVSDLELPGGAKAIGSAETIIVQCLAPVIVEEEKEGESVAEAEPEVIGRKQEDKEKE